MAELSTRDILVERFLLDERTYVDNVERLLELKARIYKVRENDQLSTILHLLYPFVDAQRRFLLAIETVARQPWESQSWAAPFRKWSEMSSMYAKFITNEKGATEFIRNVLAKEYLTKSLSFLLKDSLRLLYLPSQRLPRYSGFLKVCPLPPIIPSSAPFCDPRECY
jgi:cell division control protein 24